MVIYQYQTQPMGREAVSEALALLEGAIPPAFFPQIFGVPVPVSDTEITMRVFLVDRHGSIPTWLAARSIGAREVDADLIDTSAWYTLGALQDWAAKTTSAPTGANR